MGVGLHPHPGYSDRAVEKLHKALEPLEKDEQIKVLSTNQVDAYSLPISAAV